MSIVIRQTLKSIDGNVQRRFTSSYFIATPIFYVNASPHLGHLYTTILADASYRFNLLQNGNKPGLYSVGTDEHGTKIQQAAASKNISPEVYCRGITSEYRTLFSKFDIKFTDFVNTTEERHKATVHEVWHSLQSQNLITKGSYSGWYCDADEAFLSEDQLTTVEEGGKQIKVSSESGRPVHWVQEDNYNFNLAPFKRDIEKWINEGAIRPSVFEKRLLTWLDEGVCDGQLSVSRPATRVHWGIPVPDDPSQTIYVWLDALSNYLTVAGYPDLNQWPPDNQILGKDILKFHAIYWPAFLLGLGLELPKRISVHSHWLVDGEKMSKTKGNVICPFQAAETFTVDGLRYFLLREATPHSDSNFSDLKVTRILNSELADTLGNLLNRCSGNSVNKWQKYPEYNEETFDKYCRTNYPELISSLKTLSAEVAEHYADMNFYKGISRVMSTLHECNKMFESAKPWQLSKSSETEAQLLALLHLTMETLRISAICLSPIIPTISTALLNKLSVPIERRMWPDASPSWELENPSVPSQLEAAKVVLYKKIAVS